MSGTLYVVATPIGNLEDLTLRAKRVLEEADVIACEDTRHARILLTHYGITTPLISYHEHNERERAAELVGRLRAGKDVALISDAGTPALSDPGFPLIREAIASDCTVIVVPGPNAALAALTVAGLPTDRFVFLGFLPRRSGERIRALEALRAVPWTVIVYEAPHRLTAVLRDLRAAFGDRRLALARELTKRFEEVFRGTISEALDHLETHRPRGEYTVVVEGASGGAPAGGSTDGRDARLRMRELLREGRSPKEAVAEVMRASGLPRREAYRLLLEVRGKR
jgi:16S rRNA (cytidine1402-2'-O)-methyltransferase